MTQIDLNATEIQTIKDALSASAPEDVAAAILAKLPTTQTVQLSQNNSGGSFWLDEDQFDALIADGWRVKPDGHQSWFGGKVSQDLLLDVPVADLDAAITIAKIEFERVTGQDANEIGCTCCGPPFSFHAVW